jgi:zinc transport system substrate-binding protein
MPKGLLAGWGVVAALLLGGAGAVRAEVAAVATIKPIHSLVAAVMQGVGEPHLLLAAGSPHSYSLKPSDARALQRAKLVFQVGPQLETFLVAPLQTLAGDARVVTLAEASGLTLLPYRTGGDWDAHDHDGEDRDEHGDAHANKHEDGEPAHAPGGTDMHLWLDPANGRAMVGAIAAALADADPANAERYRANAAALQAKLDALGAELAPRLAPLRGKPFVVFHDAYQYFERAFGLQAAGSVTVSPERQTGARHLAELRERIARLRVVCVFAEPQFEPRLVATLIEGTGARSGTLDPIGADLAAGADLYVALLRRNADALAACLQ